MSVIMSLGRRQNGMAKKTFTDEEIAFLKENPYTAFVDRHTLSFTVAFKADEFCTIRMRCPRSSKMDFSGEIIFKNHLFLHIGPCAAAGFQCLPICRIGDRNIRVGEADGVEVNEF